MFKKKINFLLIAVVVMAMALPVSARREAIEPNLPEQAGIYTVPGRPDLKLRVFVYQEKQDKPGKPGPIAPEEICSLSDPNSYAEIASAGWVLPSSWAYRLNLNSVPTTVGSNNLVAITNNAFNEWLGAINNKVNIQAGNATTVNKAQFDGQNIITWGRASGTALAVTYIWYNNQGVATEIDTIMNNKFTWYWSNPNTWGNQLCAYSGVYDAQNILTHELGHTFGLDDHYTSEYANNTMYGYGAKTETKKDTLAAGDINGVSKLY